MTYGTVKFFDNDRGFGFITPDGGGADMFVHISALRGSGADSLDQGDRVSFDTTPDPKKNKPHAVNVQLL